MPLKISLMFKKSLRMLLFKEIFYPYKLHSHSAQLLKNLMFTLGLIITMHTHLVILEKKINH